MTKNHLEASIFTTFVNVKTGECNNIHSVNPFYLRIDHANGYIEEKNENKYLVFDSADENKELLKNRTMFRMELRTKSKK